MSLTTVLALAVALAMDTFTVCLTTGIGLRNVRLSHTMRMAGVFGFCQFLMPVIGWMLGVRAQKYIEAYDHWLAFALLLFVGGKMLWETWNSRGEVKNECLAESSTRGAKLLLLGIATSLDALAVGLSLALLGQQILLPALIIGLVCFLISVSGMYLGTFICRLPGLANVGSHASVIGGLVLLGIGFSILNEHGIFG